ncbi:MAG: dephospho-CoA kinase, partial [Clostridia bacterium]|nr:dephospho-CoA kinase [Clostridia bacterium]
IGGIGSGKSKVISILSQFGERVCDCDEIYKQVCEKPEYIRSIDENFHTVKDGAIDKKALAATVFSDREKLSLLNSLAHPYVFKELERIYRQEDGVLFAEVSAFDNSMKEYFDTVIFVRSEKSTRIERVKNRDGKKEDYILSVMAGQLSDEEMEGLSDFVIVNDGNEQALESQIEWILQWLQK